MGTFVVVAVQDQVENYWNFVAAGYGIAAVSIGGYVIHLVRRGRKLSRRVSPQKRRWM